MHLLPLLAFALVSSASPLSVHYTTRHVLREVPTGWAAVASAPAEHLIDMRIGLKQARMDELLATLAEVSDPAHVRYGMHLSKAEVDELVAPHDETVKTVEEWLGAHGVKVTERSPAGDWLHVLVPVARAEQMLNTRYNVYRHTSGNHIVRSESYALPRWLDDHVDLIQPTTFFGKIHERRFEFKKRAPTLFVGEPVSANAALDCSLTITPACLRSLYKTDGYAPNAIDRNSLGITGYLGNHNDLQKFYEKYLPNAAKNGTFSVELVTGGLNVEESPGAEASLDIQYGGAMSYPTPNIFYSTAGRPPSNPESSTIPSTNEPYLEWMNYLLAKSTLPFTISTSYADEEQTVPLDYAIRVCNMFAQLGARGVSLLFASGDSGVGGKQCLTNPNMPSGQRFVPTFPASCPFVTAVGGTHGVSPEIGMLLSQGGFSNYFNVPDYQSNAVAGFKASLGDTYRAMYNETGRGFPDVAAQGQNFQIILGNFSTLISGTSASCPTFAGVISLLNDYRLSQGKPSLGFLNPWLYANPGMLNDITNGNNPGCGTSGFNATVGWDPVTGLGTPDFLKMMQMV